MKRALIIILILVVVIGGSVAAYLYLTPQTYSVAEDDAIETLTVETDTIIASVDAAGRLEADDTATVSFETGGKVTEVLVEVNDTVAAGDTLAYLEQADLVEAVTLAEIELQRAEAQLAKLLTPPNQADITAAQATIDSAQAGLNDLFLGADETDIAAAEVAIDSAQANLDRVLQGPSSDTLTAAAGTLRKTEIALRQAQEAYNEVSWDDRAANAAGMSLEQATIDYETALANYNLAAKSAENPEILSAQAQRASAEANLQKLLDGPTEAQIAAAQSQLIQAQSNLEKLMDGPTDEDIRLTELTVETAKVNLARAQRNLERATIYSPIDGVITTLNLNVGDFVAAGNPVLSLADVSNYKLSVEIDEIDIGRIAEGQSAEISLDALQDEAYTGVVDEIGVAPASAATGIVAYPVTLHIAAADAPFRIGMNVNVAIETERLEDVVVVPNRAVEVDRETGKTYVDKVIDDATIERVEIELGRRGSQVSQVLSGLDAGDLIAIQEVSRRDQLRQSLQGG